MVGTLLFNGLFNDSATLKAGNHNDRVDARDTIQPHSLSSFKTQKRRRDHGMNRPKNHQGLPTLHGLESAANIFATSSCWGSFYLDFPPFIEPSRSSTFNTSDSDRGGAEFYSRTRTPQLPKFSRGLRLLC